MLEILPNYSLLTNKKMYSYITEPKYFISGMNIDIIATSTMKNQFTYDNIYCKGYNLINFHFNVIAQNRQIISYIFLYCNVWNITKILSVD